ncbi:MAG TPA: hypothetical protein VIQ31_25385, partial [Phormidium sp.]
MKISNFVQIYGNLAAGAAPAPSYRHPLNTGWFVKLNLHFVNQYPKYASAINWPIAGRKFNRCDPQLAGTSPRDKARAVV